MTNKIDIASGGVAGGGEPLATAPLGVGGAARVAPSDAAAEMDAVLAETGAAAAGRRHGGGEPASGAKSSGSGSGVAPGLVLYEDEWLLAADKPAGIIVHGDGTGQRTLTDLVREYLLATGQADAARELQAVQRLDRDTSGVVLFSKNKEVQPRLDALVAEHAGITKRYLAVVRGNFPEGESLIKLPLARDRHDARRMRVDASGKPSATRVCLLATAGARSKRLSLVECTLLTGRKHQIRVHLASRGYPIMGDALYGVPADRSGRTALMLHAKSEQLVHPVTGEDLYIISPYPQRFAKLFPGER